MTAIVEISVIEAARMIAERQMVILDRRDFSSYQQGHIDGAMMAHDGLVESLIKKRDVTTPLMIYCYRGNSSKDLAALFSQFGYQEVYSMAGGYVEWKRVHGHD